MSEQITLIEIVRAAELGVLTPDQMTTPNWFYRPVGLFRDTFVEETL